MLLKDGKTLYKWKNINFMVNVTGNITDGQVPLSQVPEIIC